MKKIIILIVIISLITIGTSILIISSKQKEPTSPSPNSNVNQTIIEDQENYENNTEYEQNKYADFVVKNCLSQLLIKSCDK